MYETEKLSMLKVKVASQITPTFPSKFTTTPFCFKKTNPRENKMICPLKTWS
jgi:hypothetical protein